VSAAKKNIFKAIDFLLRVESGPDAGRAYRLQPPKIIVGRDPNCQIPLTDPKTSRKQLVITFTNNVICEDVSSRKTTCINGKPCGKTVLRPGDEITFGQTKMVFSTKANEQARPQLTGSAAGIVTDKEKQAAQKRFRIFLIVIILMAGSLILLEDSSEPPPEEKLATQKDLQQQIDETEERMSLVREEIANERSRTTNDNRYLYSVERHFISGFRDFQNGRYGRALDSFGTTIATEPNHPRAQLYSKTARKKRSDLIDTHLRDGEKYKEKLMYNRCAAEFEKALVLINNVNSTKYKLAKAQLDECNLLQSGGFR
jgi:hypothetical protein